jgi:tryptophan-rich sensory protein
MLGQLARLGWIGWLICALGAVLLAVAANLYILLARPFGATAGIPIDQTGPVGALIGAIVPYVWLVLFAGMGSSFWLLARADPRLGGRAWLVLALVLLCVAYPVYTGNLNQPLVALGGNAVVVLVAAIAAWRLWPVTRLGAALLLPVIAWVCLASVALLALITGQRF